MKLKDADALLDTICGAYNILESSGIDMTIARSITVAIINEAPTIESKWISVKDRLPEETNIYLVYLRNNYGIELDFYSVSDDRFHRNPELVDYWMKIPPLPEPPKEDNDETD